MNLQEKGDCTRYFIWEDAEGWMGKSNFGCEYCTLSKDNVGTRVHVYQLPQGNLRLVNKSDSCHTYVLTAYQHLMRTPVIAVEGPKHGGNIYERPGHESLDLYRIMRLVYMACVYTTAYRIETHWN